jgi:SAM-dependent methyltransferase
VYDDIGRGYAFGRRADPRWESAIIAMLGEAERVVNVGAGSGSYEPSNRAVVAVEPSAVMVAQRGAGSAPVVAGVAERVPVKTRWADAAMTILSVHHWGDWRAGLSELRRLASRRVVFTFDPAFHAEFWLIRDYMPEIADFERSRVPPVEGIAEVLGDDVVVTPVEVAWDCIDGVLPAHWRRPAAYLDPRVRACCSGFTQADPDVIERGVRSLAADLASGAWYRRYVDLLEADTFDAGFRIVASVEP